MREKEITVRTADGEMTVFVTHPDGAGSLPVAVLYMYGVGYREQLKENARRFAAGGYCCVAPDLFYRGGPRLTFDLGRVAAQGFGGPEGERMMSLVRSLTPKKVVSDTEALLEAIATDPAARPGPKVCVGYCMGARFALHAASALSDQLVAAACIHPGALVTDQPDSPHHDLDGFRGELYVSFAENDRSATPEVVDRFRSEMERRGIRGVVERVPGTAHGYAMADLAVYDRPAAERHFERTLELWHRNLSGQPVGA